MGHVIFYILIKTFDLEWRHCLQLNRWFREPQLQTREITKFTTIGYQQIQFGNYHFCIMIIQIFVYPIPRILSLSDTPIFIA